MALPSLEWLSRAGEYVVKAIPLTGALIGSITWAYDLGDRLVAGTLNWAISQISAIDTSVFSNATFGLVAGIGYANAVFPLTEFVSIWTAVFVGIGAINVIRWTKSFIPTMSN